MKKLYNLIAVILLFAISIFSYILLINIEMPKGFDILWFFLIQVFGIIIIIPLFVAFHEAGHMVFGLLTGYRLTFYKVGPFEWISNEENKIKFHLGNFSLGILGQCLMYPPKYRKKGKKPFFWYNAGGLIFSYLMIIILIILFIIGNKYLRYLMMPCVMISIFLALNNSIYIKNGINDVSNGVFISKNKKYINTIMYQLEVVGNIIRGKRYGAKATWEPYYETRLNHISLPVIELLLYNAIDHDDFNSALEYSKLLEKNYHNCYFVIQKISVLFDLLYTDIVINNDINKFKRRFSRITKQEQKIICRPKTDLDLLFKIYQKIYHKNYEISGLVKQLINDETIYKGEKLSLEKRYNFLIEKLNNWRCEK